MKYAGSYEYTNILKYTQNSKNRVAALVVLQNLKKYFIVIVLKYMLHRNPLNIIL